MTLDVRTQDLTASAARDLTDRIRVAVEGTWVLIRDAYMGRVWVPLGYGSWDEYTTREFGNSRLRLPREERQEQVASLRDAGLSIRAIEAGLGVSRHTVIEDLRSREQVVQSAPPRRPIEDVERDMDDPDAWGEPVEPTWDEVPDWAATPPTTPTEGTPIITPKPITGIDGKNYTPTERPQRRGSILDTARSVGIDLRRAIERLERLEKDDRFQRNKAEIGAVLRPHLDLAAEALTRLR